MSIFVNYVAHFSIVFNTSQAEATEWDKISSCKEHLKARKYLKFVQCLAEFLYFINIRGIHLVVAHNQR